MFSRISFLAFFAILSFSFFSKAQNLTIEGGFNFSQDILSDKTYYASTQAKSGFQLGLMAEIPVYKGFAIESGIYWVNRSMTALERSTCASPPDQVEKLFRTNSLYLPLKVRKTFKWKELSFAPSIGPYLGFGVSGKTKARLIPYEGWHSETKKEWISNVYDSQFNRFDFGLVFGTGVEFKRMRLGVFYNMGLRNIAAKRNEEYSIKNRTLGISIGYSIFKKNKTITTPSDE